MPNITLITDGTKAVPLSALAAEAWSPADPLEAGETQTARKLRAVVPVLHRALDVRGKAVAGVALRLERGGKDVADTPQGRAVLAQLRDLMYRTELGLCFVAAAYWELGTNRAGRNLTPFWCATGSVAEWRDPRTGAPTFTRASLRVRDPNSGQITAPVIPPEQIAAIYLPSDAVDVGPDPEVAPVRATLAGAGLLRYLDAYSSAFFARGGIKITLLQLDSGLSKPERDKLKAWWDMAVRGVRSAFSSLVISNKVEPKVIGSDPKDTAAPSLQKAAREDVAVGLGVPQSLLISSALAGGTADAERLNFYELTVFPEADLILPVANERWLSRLGLEAVADYDRMEVRQWAFAQRAKAMGELTGGKAILEVNEARARLGLDPHPSPPPPLDEGGPPTPSPDGLPGADAATKALAQWEAKALSRLRRGRSPAVGFESDYLDPEEADLILARLHGAQDAQAVKAAFQVPPPGDGLSDAERALYEALRPIFARYGAQALAAALAGESFDDAALAQAIQAAMAAALAPQIAAQALDLAAGVGLDPAYAAGLGTAYAQATLRTNVAGITETTRAAITKAADLYRRTPGMTRGQLEQILAPTFGARRAESIAITETTNAASAATTYAQQYLADAGLTFVRIWRTSNDDLTCPICAPLNGKPEGEWPETLKDGPAAHTRCRCFTTLEPVEEALA